CGTRPGPRGSGDGRKPFRSQDDAGQGYALKLTAAALEAIAVDEESEAAIATSKATRPQPRLHPDATNAQGPDIIGEHIKRPGSRPTRGPVARIPRPDIAKPAVEERPPDGYGLKDLVDLPMAGPDQWRTLGLEAPAWTSGSR